VGASPPNSILHLCATSIEQLYFNDRVILLVQYRSALHLLFQSHFRSNPMPERAERRAIPHRIVFPACDHTFHRKIKEQVYFNDRVTLLVQ
jgi:hypothetical protein